MSAIGFNTLEAAEDLQASGVDEAQAGAIVTTVHRAIGEGMATMERVSADFAAMGDRLCDRLDAPRAYRLKTAIGIVAVNATITVALLKLHP